jgi:ABC-type dipeptide/oligopeptide/nickel transport system permease component
MLIALLIGLVAGVVSALRQHSFFDHGASLVALIGVSVPVFWLAMMLIWLFAHRWGDWTHLPTSDRISPLLSVPTRTGSLLIDTLLTRDLFAFRDALRHLILPAIALGAISSAFIMRMTRTSMLEVKGQDYVRTARAKGLSGRGVLRHQIRNALIPIVTVVGLQTGTLLGGAIITETIFSWEGLGSYLVDRIRQRDLQAVCAATMLMAGVFVVVNLIVDLLYHAIDPRLRT